MSDQTPTELAVDNDKDRFVPDRDIIVCDSDVVDADLLYDIRTEAEQLNQVSMASRVEIERRNLLQHSDYKPQFSQTELMEIGLLLTHAKQERYERGESERIERISEIAAEFLDQITDEVSDE